MYSVYTVHTQRATQREQRYTHTAAEYSPLCIKVLKNVWTAEKAKNYDQQSILFTMISYMIDDTCNTTAVCVCTVCMFSSRERVFTLSAVVHSRVPDRYSAICIMIYYTQYVHMQYIIIVPYCRSIVVQ